MIQALFAGSRAAVAFAAMAALAALGLVIAPSSLSIGAMSSLLPFAGILAIASVGQHLVVQQRGLDLSVAGNLSFTAVVVTALPRLAGANGSTLLFIALALASGALIGLLNGILVVIARIPALIATIGINAVLIGLTVLLSGGVSQQAPGSLNDFGVSTVAGLPTVGVVALIFVLAVSFTMSRTVVGRRLTAIACNPIAAHAAGLPVGPYLMGAFAFAGFTYSFAGILLAAYLLSPSVLSGSPYALASVAAVAVGGNSIGGGLPASVLATAIGALLLTYLSQLMLSAGFDVSMQAMVQAAIVLVSSVMATHWRR